MGQGVIIDERVPYPGRPAQKELLKPEQLSGDGRDIVCTPQVVQGLAPSASTAYYVLKLSTRYSPGSTDAISPPLTLALARDGFRWPRAAVIMLGGGVAEM